MASLLVLKDNYIIDERQFQETFIVIGEKDLYWHFYPSEVGIWTTSADHQKTVIVEDKIKNGGQQLAMILTELGHEISCVLPSWSLSINDTDLPRGFYSTFVVTWEKIKLSYLTYEFLFTFNMADSTKNDFPKLIY